MTKKNDKGNGRNVLKSLRQTQLSHNQTSCSALDEVPAVHLVVFRHSRKSILFIVQLTSNTTSSFLLNFQELSLQLGFPLALF